MAMALRLLVGSMAMALRLLVGSTALVLRLVVGGMTHVHVCNAYRSPSAVSCTMQSTKKAIRRN